MTSHPARFPRRRSTWTTLRGVAAVAVVAALLAACSTDAEEKDKPGPPRVLRLFEDGAPHEETRCYDVVSETGEEFLAGCSVWEDGPHRVLVRQIPVRSDSRYHLTCEGLAANGAVQLRVLGLEGELTDLEAAQQAAVLAARLSLGVLVQQQLEMTATPSAWSFKTPPGATALLVTWTCEDGVTLSLDSFRLEVCVPRAPQRRRVGAQTRQAVALATGELWSVPLPAVYPGDHLDLAVGLPRDAARLDSELRVRARVGEQEATATLQEATDPSPPRTWQDLSLRFSGPVSSGRLELSVQGPPGVVALVAEPLLCRPRRAGGPPNLLLISVDTLRADHLGCYGYPRPTSPQLDASAGTAIRFSSAYAPANFTLPSHASMMTGLLPAVHGVRHLDERASIRALPSLARILADAGYLCAAFTAGGYLADTFGFDAGFDRYGMLDPLMSPRNDRRATGPRREDPDYNRRLRDTCDMECVLGWIEDHRGDPFFLFLHTYHVHDYCPSEESARLFEPLPLSTLGWNPRNKPYGELHPGSPQLQHFRNFYDATIRDVDGELGRLFDLLDRLDLRANTVVALVSDHGEAFREHDVTFHTSGLWQELLHVPVLLWVPGVEGRVEDLPISLIDLAPTFLGLLGLQTSTPFQGRMLPLTRFQGLASSAPVLAEDPSPGHTVDFALIGPKYKLVRVDAASGFVPRLFDLIDDPAEQRDLAAVQPTLVHTLLASLETHLASGERFRTELVGPGQSPAESRTLDGETENDLRALGYLHEGTDDR